MAMLAQKLNPVLSRPTRRKDGALGRPPGQARAEKPNRIRLGSRGGSPVAAVEDGDLVGFAQLLDDIGCVTANLDDLLGLTGGQTDQDEPVALPLHRTDQFGVDPDQPAHIELKRD